MNWSIWPYYPSTIPWNYGLRIRDLQSAAEGPDFDQDSLELHFVRDQHLRVANPEFEEEYIGRLIRASLRTAESFLHGRVLLPQTWRLVMNGFPTEFIELPFGPVISVESIDYVDSAGDDQTLAGSPAEFQVESESGPRGGRVRIYPLSGESWPSVESSNSSAVTVTYTAGYPLDADGRATVPEDIDAGRLLVIGELYKQRSESVHAMNQNPALRSARSLWAPYRMY
jgi:uncharacterized phiE125 gp8 family phage protein